MKFKYLTVATTAFEPSFAARESADRIIDKINNLKAENANIDIIIFCELSLNKFVQLLFEEGYLEKVAVNLNSEIVNDLKECAKKNHVNLSIGITEEKAGKYYNSQLLINREGEIISVHRKANLTSSEAKVLSKGDTTITMCEFEGITLGTSICYDLINGKPLKKCQPHLLIHALTDPGEPRFTIGASGRFNKGYYVSANRFGVEQYKKAKGDYNGHIGIVTPMGRIVELKYGDEHVIVKELKIRLKQSWFLLLIRGISSKFLIGINIISHLGKVISYLKWHFRMKREKNNKKVE